MPASAVTVYNAALSSLGYGVSLTSTNEVDRGAELCNIWYEVVRDGILSAAPWPEATAYSRLALIAERDDDADWVSTDPTPGWNYAYGVPSDFLYPRNLSDYARFSMAMRGNTRTIITNNAAIPILFYTRRLEQVYLWNANLFNAIAHGLAAHIAKGLTGKDSDVIRGYQLANEKIIDARASALNMMEQPSLESTPDWIAARGYAGSGPQAKFLYPPAEFTVSGFNNLG